MIDQLDRTLDRLLKNELPSYQNLAISFDTPDDQFSVSEPALDLFLYDVRENRDLRSNEWLLERKGDGTAVKMPPPVRVDCSYLITAWTKTKAPLDEHKLLGAVMKVLLRHSTLPSTILEEDLKGPGLPLPTTTLQPGRLQSLGEFWQALGGKPKAALNYTVTIAVEALAPIEAGRMVS